MVSPRFSPLASRGRARARFFRPRRITSDRRLLIAEPRRWSAADVAAWVQWARRQLQLPSVPLESFNVDGATLASLSEEEFCQRAPQVSANALSSVLAHNTKSVAARKMISQLSVILHPSLRSSPFCCLFRPLSRSDRLLLIVLHRRLSDCLLRRSLLSLYPPPYSCLFPVTCIR